MRNYILTHYYFPLEEPLILSNKLGIKLCNVSDNLELAKLKSFFKQSLAGPEVLYNTPGGKMRPPLNADPNIVSITRGIQGFLKRFENNKTVNSKLAGIDLNDPWDFFSKTVLVLEFDNYSDIYDSLSKEEADYYFYQDDEVPHYENAINYTHLISLLTLEGKAEENGFTFLNPVADFLIDFPEPNIRLNLSVLHFCGINQFHGEVLDYKESFWDFENHSLKLLDCCKKLESILTKESSRKLFYIGGLLKTISNTRSDTRLIFNTLVSILELLVTHSPDYNRFNVEDSINKQFRLKISILLYMSDPNIDLEFIKSDLKEIYSQRSNISHGNFIQFQKYLAKSKLVSSEDYPLHFYSLIDRLYFYVTECLNQYVINPTFVDFLKKN